MSAFEKWLIWLTSAVTTVTGAAYLWMKYFMEPAEQWSVISHPLQPWMLKAHILAAPVLVFVLGAVVLNHVPQHLRAEGRPRLVSGIAVMAATAVMILTGYLVQVITHEGWLRAAALFHIGSSFLYVAAVVVHSIQVRVAARKPILEPVAGSERSAGQPPDGDPGQVARVPHPGPGTRSRERGVPVGLVVQGRGRRGQGGSWRKGR